jgi:RNA polymerase sigma-70 factor (ECF subfamily)
MTHTDEKSLLAAARSKDRAAFDALVRQNERKLRAVIRRLVGHPDDTDDLVQDTLLKAWHAMAGFRGESAFGTWLCTIGTRAAIDHLRQQTRWRVRSQVAYANECAKSADLWGDIAAAFDAPEFVYEAREHLAYCFTCVGRSLPPEDHAALVLRDVMDFTNAEAARALDLSEGALRGRLTSARATMTEAYDGLCALVNKTGVCYQCKGLRDAAPEGKKGGPVPTVASFEDRLAIARAADVDGGASQRLHDASWRRTQQIEDDQRGSAEPETDCGT